jgi:hypothetical protein
MTKKYFLIYQKAVEQHEKDHPYWRIEGLASLIKWGLKSLKYYIEDVRAPKITWESPLVELHYPIDWNWKKRGFSDLAPGGHIYGKFTARNTATKQLAVKTLSLTMARQFNAMMLADATNWAWYEKLNNYYTPVLPVQFVAELDAIKNKHERRERFDELVRPFSIGATRIDCADMKFKSGSRVPKRVVKQLVESRQRMDIPGIKISGDVNGRKFDAGLIFEIHPLIADYDTKKAFHPIVVGLAWLSRTRMFENRVVQDTPSHWPKVDREQLWKGVLQEVDKIAGMLIPKSESGESVIVSVNSKLKIPIEHWKPENRSAQIKKVADALAPIGEVEQLNVESIKTIDYPHNQNACPVCGWVHDPGFTQIKTSQNETIILSGILPGIVALAHGTHEKGLPALSTKDDYLLKICGGYGNPCKAFDDLKHRDDYKKLFDTRKRGFISLRGANGINRKLARNDIFRASPKLAGVTLISVNSSAIAAVGYDGHTLTVVFHTGRTYDHPNVPYGVYVEFMNAPSLGTYYNRHIRGRYK